MSTKEKIKVDAIEMTWTKYGYGVRAFKDGKPVTKRVLFETELEAIVYASNNFTTEDENE